MSPYRIPGFIETVIPGKPRSIFKTLYYKVLILYKGKVKNRICKYRCFDCKRILYQAKNTFSEMELYHHHWYSCPKRKTASNITAAIEPKPTLPPCSFTG